MPHTPWHPHSSVPGLEPTTGPDCLDCSTAQPRHCASKPAHASKGLAASSLCAGVGGCSRPSLPSGGYSTRPAARGTWHAKPARWNLVTQLPCEAPGRPPAPELDRHLRHAGGSASPPARSGVCRACWSSGVSAAGSWGKRSRGLVALPGRRCPAADCAAAGTSSSCSPAHEEGGPPGSQGKGVAAQG